jgi:hypothetical protein
MALVRFYSPDKDFAIFKGLDAKKQLRIKKKLKALWKAEVRKHA